MFAGTKFNWYDASFFSSEVEIAELNERPLILAGFSADKGTEKLIRISGEDFYKMYGNKSSLSFARHGQPLLQASRVIDAGGELLCKRVVASDATLSNIILVANVTKETTHVTDAEGNKLYINYENGEQTTAMYGEYATEDDIPEEVKNGDSFDLSAITNLPVEKTAAKIKWETETAENCKTFEEVMEAAEALLDDEGGVYPMYIVTDIGRNADCKAFRITPDYTSSKGIGFMIYGMAEIEGTTVSEMVNMTANPDVMFRQNSYAVNKYSMGQLYTGIIDGVYESYITKLAEIAEMEVEDLKTYDVLFGCNTKGVSLPNIVIDSEGVDISADYGVPLESGSIGTKFGTSEFYKSDAYKNELVDLFMGRFDDAIFDLDVHKIYACVDANYPDEVKKAIVVLANHREDFFFFRDLGLGLTTYEMIAARKESMDATKFAADYLTTYMVIDPNTKKRIEVTMMYDLAPIVVNHFVKGAAIPLAGEINDVVLESAIEGTINYIPRNTLTVNQKDLLDDLRVNYATYYEYGGKLVVESLYTAYAETSQLSYINNVISIQEVMRALRTTCPKNRFKFQTGNDFTDYEEACKAVLTNFKPFFSKLEFTYTQDELKSAQKIFYASIEFAFNNWAQTEVFDLYAVNTELSE